MSTVKDFVENTIRDNKIVIFSKSWCSYSARSKAYFARNLPTETVFIVELDEREDEGAIQDYLKKKTNLRTVPQTFINGSFVGDDSTLQVKSKGEVQRLINDNPRA
ncbi:glutaredoxin [Scleroderma citrinum]